MNQMYHGLPTVALSFNEIRLVWVNTIIGDNSVSLMLQQKCYLVDQNKNNTHFITPNPLVKVLV